MYASFQNGILLMKNKITVRLYFISNSMRSTQVNYKVIETLIILYQPNLDKERCLHFYTATVLSLSEFI